MLKAYKRMLRGYREGLRAFLEALVEVFLGLFFLSLPVTFWVVYPVYAMVRRYRRRING